MYNQGRILTKQKSDGTWEYSLVEAEPTQGHNEPQRFLHSRCVECSRYSSVSLKTAANTQEWVKEFEVESGFLRNLI